MEIIHTDVRVLRVKVFSRWVLVCNPWVPNGLCLYQIPVLLKVDNINKSFDRNRKEDQKSTWSSQRKWIKTIL